MKDGLGKRFLLLLCVLLISLAVAEGALRFFDLADPPAFGWKPQYGYLMQPNQSVSTRGFRFRINNAGFRGPDFALPKPKGTFRIVFLGDSITYGGGEIPDKDLFVNRVASSLSLPGDSRIEAINLSAPGWGIQNMAGYVAAKGVFEADFLIWVIASADFRRPKMSLENNYLPREKPSIRVIYAASVGFRRVSLFVSRQVSKLFPNSTDQGKAQRTLKENVRTFHHTLAHITHRGTPCAVVVVPGSHHYRDLLKDFPEFLASAESLSVPILHMGTVFKRHRSERLFSDGLHLSVHGHEVVADAIVPFIKENFLPYRKRTAS